MKTFSFSTLKLWLYVTVNEWRFYLALLLYNWLVRDLDERLLGKHYNSIAFYIRKINRSEPATKYRKNIRKHPQYQTLKKSFIRWLHLHPNQMDEFKRMYRAAWLFRYMRCSDLQTYHLYLLISDYEPFVVCKLLNIPPIVWFYVLFDTIDSGVLK